MNSFPRIELETVVVREGNSADALLAGRPTRRTRWNFNRYVAYRHAVLDIEG